MAGGPVTRYDKAWVLGLMQVRVGPSAANIDETTAVLTNQNSIGALADVKLLANAEFFKQMSGFPLTEDGVIPMKDSAAIQASFKEITPFTMALARGIDPTASIAAGVVMDVGLVSTAGTGAAVLSIAAGASAVTDEFWVVFTGATDGEIYGRKSGHVHTFANLTSAMEPSDLFSIPANFFTGTWASGDVYAFRTSAASADNAYPGDPASWASATPELGLGGLAAPANVRIEGVYTYPNRTNTMTVIFPRAQITANIDMSFAEEDAAAVPLSLESKNASSDNAAGNAVWDAMPLGKIFWA